MTLPSSLVYHCSPALIPRIFSVKPVCHEIPLVSLSQWFKPFSSPVASHWLKHCIPRLVLYPRFPAIGWSLSPLVPSLLCMLLQSCVVIWFWLLPRLKLLGTHASDPSHSFTLNPRCGLGITAAESSLTASGCQAALLTALPGLALGQIGSSHSWCVPGDRANQRASPYGQPCQSLTFSGSKQYKRSLFLSLILGADTVSAVESSLVAVALSSPALLPPEVIQVRVASLSAVWERASWKFTLHSCQGRTVFIHPPSTVSNQR